MDAVKFIEERKRLCSTYSGCTECPVFSNNDTCLFSDTNGGTPDEQVKILSVWIANHPRKTRQEVFLEQYPEAEIDLNGLLEVCPAAIFLSHRGKGGGCSDYTKNCAECRREFWSQEVK